MEIHDDTFITLALNQNHIFDVSMRIGTLDVRMKRDYEVNLITRIDEINASK